VIKHKRVMQFNKYLSVMYRRKWNVVLVPINDEKYKIALLSSQQTSNSRLQIVKYLQRRGTLAGELQNRVAQTSYRSAPAIARLNIKWGDWGRQLSCLQYTKIIIFKFHLIYFSANAMTEWQYSIVGLVRQSK